MSSIKKLPQGSTNYWLWACVELPMDKNKLMISQELERIKWIWLKTDSNFITEPLKTSFLLHCPPSHTFMRDVFPLRNVYGRTWRQLRLVSTVCAECLLNGSHTSNESQFWPTFEGEEIWTTFWAQPRLIPHVSSFQQCILCKTDILLSRICNCSVWWRHMWDFIASTKSSCKSHLT